MPRRRIVVGVCAMDKKTFSAPMTQILDRLRAYGEFEVVVFGNKVGRPPPPRAAAAPPSPELADFGRDLPPGRAARREAVAWPPASRANRAVRPPHTALAAHRTPRGAATATPTRR